jgi:hypothetical protein
VVNVKRIRWSAKTVPTVVDRPESAATSQVASQRDSRDAANRQLKSTSKVGI